MVWQGLIGSCGRFTEVSYFSEEGSHRAWLCRNSYLFSAIKIRGFVPETRKVSDSIAVPLLFWTSPASFFFLLLHLHSVFVGCLEFLGVCKQGVSRFSDTCEKPKRRIFYILLINATITEGCELRMLMHL